MMGVAGSHAPQLGSWVDLRLSAAEIVLVCPVMLLAVRGDDAEAPLWVMCKFLPCGTGLGSS